MSDEERDREEDCLDGGGGAIEKELSVCLSMCVSL